MTEELVAWMDARKLSAADVGKRMGVAPQTVRNWRSSGVPERKREHLRRMMEQWDVHPESSLSALVLRPSREQFREWNRAALRQGKLIEDWAVEGLQALAAEENKPHLHGGEHDPPIPRERIAMGE